MTKYRNVRVEHEGLKFDSKRELSRWLDLLLLQGAGEIEHLERQISFELCPSVKFAGAKRAQPALRLILDFSYYEDGKRVLEDVKGMITTAFTIKRHILKDKYGLDVRIIK